MKFTKMSLITALLIGSSAFAIDNIKASGDANVFYNTSDAGDQDLFTKDASDADASLNLAISADLVGNDLVKVSGKAAYTMISTLGLENNFVSGVWGNSHNVANLGTNNSSYGTKVENASWMTEAYVTVAMQDLTKTSVMLGRMELDTPLAFTETWSIEKNTFEAAVVVNQDISDTTIVGAYVGNGNGTEVFGTPATATLNGADLTTGGIVATDGKFSTYGSDGAYALGVVNNSFEPLTVQAWYYNVQHVAAAYWIQADLACKMVPGLLAGVQYSGITVDKDARLNGTTLGVASDVDSDVFAVMLGYEMKDVVTAKFSYSQVGEDFAAGFNTATDHTTAQSKLYTETWWSYGQVTKADTSAMNLTVESPVNGIVDLGLYATMTDTNDKTDMTEITVTAGKDFGPLNATLALINTDLEENDDATMAVQAYLTLAF